MNIAEAIQWLTEAQPTETERAARKIIERVEELENWFGVFAAGSYKMDGVFRPCTRTFMQKKAQELLGK